MKLTKEAKLREFAEAALHEFAEAVKALPIAVYFKCEMLGTALFEIDYDNQFQAIVTAAVKRFRMAPGHDDFHSNRTRLRWHYRNLLAACGVESRHV